MGMEHKLVATALLAAVAAFLLSPSSADVVRNQLATQLGQLGALTAVLPQLPTVAGILCLVAIPIFWLKPH